MSPSFAVCFEGRLSEEIDASGAECTRLGAARLSRPWTVLRARRRLATLLDRIDSRSAVVVCHSSWIYALAAPVVRRSTSRLVLWLHDRVTGGSWPERWAARTRPDLDHREQQIHRGDRGRALSRSCAFRPLRAGSRRRLRERPGAGACVTWRRGCNAGHSPRQPIRDVEGPSVAARGGRSNCRTVAGLDCGPAPARRRGGLRSRPSRHSQRPGASPAACGSWVSGATSPRACTRRIFTASRIPRRSRLAWRSSRRSMPGCRS